MARLRYAVLISFNDAVLSTLSISYKLPARATAALLLSVAVADLKDAACAEVLREDEVLLGEKAWMDLGRKGEGRVAYIGERRDECIKN